MAIKKKEVDLGEKGHFEEKPGALHRNLGIPQGEKIGASRIEAATHSSSPTIRKEADSAKGFEAMHHPKSPSPFGKPKPSPAPSPMNTGAAPSMPGPLQKKKIFGKPR